jgi:Ni/Fe-hydrogenase subunit HybB-like protein
MIAFIEKQWVLIGIVITTLLIACPIFYPALSAPAAIGVSIFCLGMAVIFAIRSRADACRRGNLPRRRFVFLAAFDLLGILLAMCTAILIGRLAGQSAGAAAARWAESTWPGRGSQPGMLAGILAALLAGIATGLLVNRAWNRLSTILLREPAKGIATDSPRIS